LFLAGFAWASLLFGSAHAAPRFGVGGAVGLQTDFLDRGRVDTRLQPGPVVAVPVRIAATPSVTVRTGLRFGFAQGVDTLTWGTTVDGFTARVEDDGSHKAFAVTGLAEVGLDVAAPVRGRVVPYAVVDLRGGFAGMYHALAGNSRVLLDPAQNNIGSPSNVDPYTTSGTLGGGLGLGVRTALGGGAAAPREAPLSLEVEVGWSGAWWGAADVRKASPALDARREAFAWDGVTASVALIGWFDR
jgi:hypothetical protein